MPGRTWVLVVAAVAASAAYYGRALATPASGFSGTTMAVGRFDSIDVSNHMVREFQDPTPFKDLWLSHQKTKGPSDLYVQNNLWLSGGTTGWHTHPGHSLIIVTAGTVSVYEGDDPTCTPTEYGVGMGFVDPGGEHVHLIRNEGSVDARTVAVQLVAAGATRRIDAGAPQACQHLQ